MSDDIKSQFISKIEKSPMFALQVDELTDVASCAQVMVFVRASSTENVCFFSHNNIWLPLFLALSDLLTWAFWDS